MFGVVDHYFDAALEGAGVGLETHLAHVHRHVSRDDAGDVVDEADVVHTGEQNRGRGPGFAPLLLASPPCLQNAVTILGKQLRGIGAGRAVNLDAARNRHEAEDIVARNGPAASRHRVVAVSYTHLTLPTTSTV